MKKAVSCLWMAGVMLVALALPATPAIFAVALSVPTLDEPFPIADDPLRWESSPAVAYDPHRHRFLVVFQLDVAGIKAVCLSDRGHYLVGHDVTANGKSPDVVYNQGHDQYLIVWEESGDVRGARLAGDCEPGSLSPSFTISGDRPGTEAKPRVAHNRHDMYQDYLVVWIDQQVTLTAVWARRVSATGLVAPSFAVATETGASSTYPDVAYNLNHNEYLIVYVRDPGGQGAKDIYGRRVHNAGGGGLLPTQVIDASSGDQDHPVVAAHHLNQANPYLVVFRDYWNDAPNGDVRGYLCTVKGEPWSLLNIATASGKTEGAPAIANADSLGYTLVWQQYDPETKGWAIFGRRVTGQGDMQPSFEVSLGNRPLPAGHEEHWPAVARGAPSALVVWQENLSTPMNLDILGRFLGYRVYLPLLMRR